MGVNRFWYPITPDGVFCACEREWRGGRGVIRWRDVLPFLDCCFKNCLLSLFSLFLRSLASFMLVLSLNSEFNLLGCSRSLHFDSQWDCSEEPFLSNFIGWDCCDEPLFSQWDRWIQRRQRSNGSGDHGWCATDFVPCAFCFTRHDLCSWSKNKSKILSTSRETLNLGLGLWSTLALKNSRRQTKSWGLAPMNQPYPTIVHLGIEYAYNPLCLLLSCWSCISAIFTKYLTNMELFRQ